MSPPLPKRVIFNFADRCNMRCPFCYIPFDGTAGTEQAAKQIIGRIAEWNLTNLTFGGGDPLMYEYFCDLAEYARDILGKKVLIQVDTNGLKLNAQAIRRLGSVVDVIGLPLETTSPSTAMRMRLKDDYPILIQDRIKELNSAGIPVKVNTVVTADKLGDLTYVGQLLTEYAIKLWSLYQFWQIKPSPGAGLEKQLIPTVVFRKIVESLTQLFPGLRIESGAVDERRASYFFVTQTGRCYTVRMSDPPKTHEYVELGSIFTDTTLEQWAQIGSPAANAERAIRRSQALTSNA